MECRSNYDLLVFVKFNGFDLTWTSSNGREYQCGLIRDGILVGRCVESDGVITCVFNTSITEGILECCAGPCDNITLCKFNIVLTYLHWTIAFSISLPGFGIGMSVDSDPLFPLYIDLATITLP